MEIIGALGKIRILVMAGQWRTAVALIWHVGNAHKGIRRFTAVCHPDAKQRDIDPGVLRYQPTTWAEVKVPLPAGAMRVPHRDRQEILIALHPGPSIGEGLIHAGRLNIGKCKSLAPRRPLGRRAQRSSFQFEPRSRSVHEPQHGRVLPKKQKVVEQKHARPCLTSPVSATWQCARDITPSP